MSAQKKFGGNWSDKKLRALQNYLPYWGLVLKNSNFQKIYIDAFAGAGTQVVEGDDGEIDYRHGSPFIALETSPPFDEFFFIEKNPTKLNELREKIESSEHRHRKINYLKGDANTELAAICEQVDWKSSRAVAFLDPFALQVEWRTIQILGRTTSIDLWLLFSAMAANRMMPKSGNLDSSWIEKLNKTFGNSEWSDEFYQSEPDLFEAQTVKKTSPFDIMSNFVTRRLSTEFEAVNDNPLILKNSSNTPIFLFCFACGNKKGSGPALRIANHIIEKEQ